MTPRSVQLDVNYISNDTIDCSYMNNQIQKY
jgi:hypothetical protein